MEAIKVENQYFYPRSPCGERPKEAATTANTALFLSTLSLRRATPRSRDNSMGRNISIHALLAESDVCGCFHPDRQSPYFYPRSPCGERRQIDAVRLTGLYFYPRSPCGERPADRCGASYRSLFLSTLSLRRATKTGVSCY